MMWLSVQLYSLRNMMRFDLVHKATYFTQNMMPLQCACTCQHVCVLRWPGAWIWWENNSMLVCSIVNVFFFFLKGHETTRAVFTIGPRSWWGGWSDRSLGILIGLLPETDGNVRLWKYPYFCLFFFFSHSSAENTHNKTKAALKKLARPFQNEIFAKRCYREIRMLRHFDHENVSVRPSVDEVLGVHGCVVGYEKWPVKNRGGGGNCHWRQRKRWITKSGLFSKHVCTARACVCLCVPWCVCTRVCVCSQPRIHFCSHVFTPPSRPVLTAWVAPSGGYQLHDVADLQNGASTASWELRAVQTRA